MPSLGDGSLSGPVAVAAGGVLASTRITINASGTLDIAQQGASAGQVLAWNGTAWAPAAPATGGSSYTLPQATAATLGGVTASTGLAVSGGALSVSYGTAAGTAAQGNDSRIVGAVQAASLAAVATSGAYADLSGKPTLLVVGTTAGTARDAAAGIAAEQAAQTAAGYAQSTANAALPQAGGVLTGALTLAGDPTAALQPATKQYADAVSARLDAAAGSTQGAVLYRSASGWVALPPGSSGQVLQSGGPGANPAWATPAGGVVTPIRTVQSGAAVTLLASDGMVVIAKAAGSPTTVTLEAGPANGATHSIKDGSGDAALNPITITPAAGTIDGATSYVINTPNGGVTLVYDAAGPAWRIRA